MLCGDAGWMVEYLAGEAHNPAPSIPSKNPFSLISTT
jgi:hypothetical protein